MANLPHFDAKLIAWYEGVAYPGGPSAAKGPAAAILQGHPHEPRSPFGEHPESAMFLAAPALFALYADPLTGLPHTEPPRQALKTLSAQLLASNGAAVNHWYFNAHQQAAGLLLGARSAAPFKAWGSHYRSPTWGEGPLGVGVYDFAAKSKQFQMCAAHGCICGADLLTGCGCACVALPSPHFPLPLSAPPLSLFFLPWRPFAPLAACPLPPQKKGRSR